MRKMRLEWSSFAQSDRDAIFDYIESDSPRAAIAVDERIRLQVETLAQFPESGRPGRVAGTRELVIYAHPTSRPIAYQAKLFGFFACCTVHNRGPGTYPTRIEFHSS